jgi:hypothetical protein
MPKKVIAKKSDCKKKRTDVKPVEGQKIRYIPKLGFIAANPQDVIEIAIPGMKLNRYHY